MAAFKLDEIDVKILEILQQRGRIRSNELAQLVDLTTPAVIERKKKLEERGVIKKYVAELDQKVLGRDIMAFVRVRIDSSVHYQEFIDRVNGTDEILACYSITGEGSHLIKLCVKDTSTLEQMLGSIQTWPGVLSTITSVVLSPIKDTHRIKVEPILPPHK